MASSSAPQPSTTSTSLASSSGTSSTASARVFISDRSVEYTSEQQSYVRQLCLESKFVNHNLIAWDAVQSAFSRRFSFLPSTNSLMHQWHLHCSAARPTLASPVAAPTRAHSVQQPRAVQRLDLTQVAPALAAATAVSRPSTTAAAGRAVDWSPPGTPFATAPPPSNVSPSPPPSRSLTVSIPAAAGAQRHILASSVRYPGRCPQLTPLSTLAEHPSSAATRTVVNRSTMALTASLDAQHSAAPSASAASPVRVDDSHSQRPSLAASAQRASAVERPAPWTKAEEDRLMALCNEHTGAEQRIDWGAVIAALATQPEQRSRSSLENKHRKLSSDAGAGKPRPWTTEEEERLMALCEQHSDAEQSIDWDRVTRAFVEQFEQRSRSSLEHKHRKLSNRSATDACSQGDIPRMHFTPPPSLPATATASKRWMDVFSGANRRNGRYRGGWTPDCDKAHKHTSACDRQNGWGEFVNEQRGLHYEGEWQHGKFHGWGAYETSEFTYYGQFEEGAVCGRGVMKYKQTAHSQPAVFVGWWNGDDEFLEGNIHSTDGRYCIAADGDERSGHCAITHVNSRSVSTAAKLTCEWRGERTRWTGRTELGSAADYYDALLGGQQSSARLSSKSPPRSRRTARPAMPPHSSAHVACPDKRCGMLFASDDLLVEHLTRVHFHEKEAQTGPPLPSADTSAAEDVSQPRTHKPPSAISVPEDDSGRWTRGHFHSDAGCVYRCETTEKRLHGSGSVTWPRSILGPPVTQYGLWTNGQLVGRLQTEEAAMAASQSYADVQAALDYCFSSGVCTYLASGRLPVTQHMYACSTCSLLMRDRCKQIEQLWPGTEPIVVLCLSCATRSHCHLGHTLLPLGECAMAVCDCGRGQASLRTPLQARLIKQALTQHTHDLNASTDIRRPCSPPLPQPWKVEADGQPLWSVSSIIAEKKEGKRRLLLTCWLGFPHSFDTWEQLESIRDTAADCVQEFNRLKDERRAWAKLTAEQRASRPYPIAPVPPVDRTHPLYKMGEPAEWSLFPSCPSLHSPAVAQYALPMLQQDAQSEELEREVEQRRQHERVKVEEEEENQASGHK